MNLYIANQSTMSFMETAPTNKSVIDRMVSTLLGLSQVMKMKNKRYLRRIRTVLISLEKYGLPALTTKKYVYESLSVYYLWYEYDREKCMKYVKLVQESPDRLEGACYYHQRFEMEYMVRNYKECKRIMMKLKTFKSEKASFFYHYMATMMNKVGSAVFNESDKKSHRISIKATRKKRYFLFRQSTSAKLSGAHKIVQRIEQIMTRYIMTDATFNIIINMTKGKECNYDKCNRKDLKRYKVCKRCKSVYYCNRLHQKLDWNNGNYRHKNYCVAREERDYNIMEQRNRAKWVDKFPGSKDSYGNRICLTT